MGFDWEYTEVGLGVKTKAAASEGVGGEAGRVLCPQHVLGFAFNLCFARSEVGSLYCCCCSQGPVTRWERGIAGLRRDVFVACPRFAFSDNPRSMYTSSVYVPVW